MGFEDKVVKFLGGIQNLTIFPNAAIAVRVSQIAAQIFVVFSSNP